MLADVFILFGFSHLSYKTIAMLYIGASLVAQMVKSLPAKWENQVWSLGWEDLLEKEMATHFSILAWRTPWMKQPGGLQFTGSQKVRCDWATLTHTSALQCCVSFCYTMKWISCMCTYTPTLLDFLPSHPPCHPSRSSQSSPCFREFSKCILE